MFALRDVGRLGMQVAFHLHVGPVKALLLIADAADTIAGDFLDPADHLGRSANLAADDDPVGGRNGFATDASDRNGGNECTHQCVRALIADLGGWA